MEIVFLGTGGGRINLVKQIRATGGFRINTSSGNIHVDPGPGALLNCHKAREDPLKTECIVVTHNHTDHVTDARVMIEAMTNYALKKGGILIASSNTLKEGIGEFHLGLVETLHEAKWGEKMEFTTKQGSLKFEFLKLVHGEESIFGFKLYGEKTVGYISDTEYFDGLGREFSGCDLLIVNCMKPEKDAYDGHLTVPGVISVLKDAKPGQAILTHLGMKMQRGGPNNYAKQIEEETGIKTTPAKDFMRIRL